MADVSQIKLPNGDTYDIKDDSASTATNWVNGSATNSVRTTGSAAEGSGYTMGTGAVAEGNQTEARGDYSHTEGIGTIAKGAGSHAEGQGTTASGSVSHAEGDSTTASGVASHAEGSNTIANHMAQHVFGSYNIADSSTAASTTLGNYVEIVGNGTSSARSNARTLDWDGNEVLAGKLTVGVAGTNSMDVATVGQIPTVPSNIVNTITTTAGAHTAITSQKSNVSFNVPTTAAHVGIKFGYTTSGNNRAVLQDSSGNLYVTQKDDNTNTTYSLSGALSSHKFTSTLTAGGSGSGTSTSDFTLAAGTGITITDDTSARKMTIACSVTNTDEKVSTAAVISETTYYPVVGADTTSAATKFYDKTGITYIGTNGIANGNNGNALLTLGNNIASTTANWKKGTIRLYGTTAYYTDLVSGNPTENGTITFPNKSGTVALTSDSPQSMIIAGQEWKNIKSNQLVFNNNFSVVTARGVVQNLDTNESQQTTVSLNLGYTTSGNNRAVQADSNGNLYVIQKDDNVTNSAGTANKTGTKMYLIAAVEQSTDQFSGLITYSNSNCYIGTDNCLYSGGAKVLTTHQTAVTSITTTAGIHTTKTSATGAVSMTIPTKTSHLTNDKGFISTAAQIIRW